MNEFQLDLSNLSVRAQTVCLNHGLISLDAFMKYMEVNRDFRRLRNCGALTNRELLNFYRQMKADKNTSNFLRDGSKDPIATLLTTISDLEYDDLSNWYYIRLNILSRRAKNAISYLQQSKDLREFMMILTHQNFNAASIKNVGRKTADEINKLVEDIREFLETYSNPEKKSLNSFGLKMLRLFNIDVDQTKVADDGAENVLHYFKVIVEQSNRLSHAEKMAFIGIYYNKSSLEELAYVLCKSPERVRQIVKKSLPSKISDLVQQISDNFQVFNELYRVFQGEYRCFSLKEMSEIHINSTYAALPFDVFIEFFCSHKAIKGYYFVNGNEPLLLPCKGGHFRYQWYQERRYPKYFWYYGIHLIELMNLRIILSEILIIFTSENKKNWILEWSALSLNLNENQKTFISEILSKEFGITTFKRGIYIHRNTRILIEELAFAALEDLGEMSNIDQIIAHIVRNNSETQVNKLNASSLRNTLTRRKDLFIYERHWGKSNYGLKLWEHLKGFKGGTIKGLVVEFLLTQDKPIHISVIGAYINKFRPETNDYSIIQNLKLDTKSRFLFYKGGFIGLNRNRLDSSETEYEQVTVEEIINGIFDY